MAPKSATRDDSSAVGTSSSQDIADSDLCPVCHLLLYRPVTTTCNHTLCESCMRHWATASRATADHSMEYFPISHVPENSKPPPPAPSIQRTGGRSTRSQRRAASEKMNATCPMCRTRTSANLDEKISRRLMKEYAILWEERRVEEEEDDLSRVGDGETVIMDIWIGNEHELNGEQEGNMHDWTFFVRPNREAIVEKVQVYLHPSFTQAELALRRPPFKISRRGWGHFNIRADIFLRKGYVWAQNDSPGRRTAPMSIDWMLNFDGDGLQGRVKVDVKLVRGDGEGV